jgi:hypothetical protein
VYEVPMNKQDVWLTLFGLKYQDFDSNDYVINVAGGNSMRLVLLNAVIRVSLNRKSYQIGVPIDHSLTDKTEYFRGSKRS